MSSILASKHSPFHKMDVLLKSDFYVQFTEDESACVENKMVAAIRSETGLSMRKFGDLLAGKNPRELEKNPQIFNVLYMYLFDKTELYRGLTREIHDFNANKINIETKHLPQGLRTQILSDICTRTGPRCKNTIEAADRGHIYCYERLENCWRSPKHRVEAMIAAAKKDRFDMIELILNSVKSDQRRLEYLANFFLAIINFVSLKFLALLLEKTYENLEDNVATRGMVFRIIFHKIRCDKTSSVFEHLPEKIRSAFYDMGVILV